MSYEFRDTTDLSDHKESMSSEAFSIDGLYPENELSEIKYRTLQVIGREELTYDLYKADSIYGVDGEALINKRLPGRELTIKFKIETQTAAEFATAYRKLKGFLVGNHRQIKFDDEPNLVYVGTLSAMDSPEPGQVRGTNTFTFFCDDVHPKSVDTKVLNATNSGGVNGSIVANEDGSVTVNVNNQGTLETYPQVKVTHTSDNGFVGLVSPESVVQLGSIEEILINNKTTEKVKYKSAWLLNEKRGNNTNFKDFANSKDTNPQNEKLETDGTIDFKNDGLRLTALGSPPVYGSYLTMGGLKKYTIPVDENKESGARLFSSYMNILAWAGKMGQTGLLQVLYMTSANKLICGFGIYKDDSKGNTTNAQYYIGGNNQRTFHNFKFPANNAEANQKPNNKNKNFNSSKGGVTITKSAGGKFKWSLTDTSQSLTVPELDSAKVSHIYVYIGQLKGRTLSTDHFMSNIVLRGISFRKDDVAMYFDESTDVETIIPANPHHYGEGEILLVDMGSAKVFKKDGSIPGNDELITGSEFFSIPPGESSFDLFFSDEMTTLPDIEISWKERYL